MGIVLGKYKEPAFDVLLSRIQNVTTPYEIRRYGPRFAVEALHGTGGSSPFPLLAGYIGVMSRAQNEERRSIAMTTPVAMHPATAQQGQKMQFLLPNEFANLSDIPKPTNENVRVTRLAPAVGAVHKYTGSLDRKRSQTMALKLAQSLRADGVKDLDNALETEYEYWRFNPPIYPPFWSRNEVWIQLTDEQADYLVNKFAPAVNAE